MAKGLFLIAHETRTAVHAGNSDAGIANVQPERLSALNAFLTINHKKNIIPLWDDDDEFEEILDSYTFITIEDANNSIYKKGGLS